MQFKGKRAAGNEDIFLFDTGLLEATEIYSAMLSAGYSVSRAAVTYKTKSGGESTKEIPPSAIPSIKKQHGFDKWSIIVIGDDGRQIVIQVIDSEHMMSMRTSDPSIMQSVIQNASPYLKSAENRKIAQKVSAEHYAQQSALPRGSAYQAYPQQSYDPYEQQYQPRQYEAPRQQRPAVPAPYQSAAPNPTPSPYEHNRLPANDPYQLEAPASYREPAYGTTSYDARQIQQQSQPPRLKPAPQYVEQQQSAYPRAVSYDYEPESPAQIVEQRAYNEPVDNSKRGRKARKEADKWNKPAKAPIATFIISLLEGLFIVPIPFSILSIVDMVSGRKLARNGNNGGAKERFNNIRNNAILGAIGVVIALALFAWKILPGLV